MSFYNLQEELEKRTGLKLKLKINDNRSTMLSVRWEPNYTLISLHRMFLEAPKNIMQELACYLKKQKKPLPLPVKVFIEENIKKLDYSYAIDVNKLIFKGKVYNLKTIYDDLNTKYFFDKLRLNITWFGKSEQTNRSKITFGLFYDPLKLIKINRLLDNHSFPDYFVSYVVYHEMLHYVCPSYIDERGLHQIHSKEFKEREKEFSHYEEAQKWIKAHRSKLFSSY